MVNAAAAEAAVAEAAGGGGEGGPQRCWVADGLDVDGGGVDGGGERTRLPLRRGRRGTTASAAEHGAETAAG